MRRLEVRNPDRGASLGDRIELADRWWPRLRGYLGRPEPEEGEGILFVSTQSIHMYWMKYALDVAFLDGEGKVVATYPELRPGTHTRRHKEARYALEVPAGTLAATGTEVGDTLRWKGNGRPPVDDGRAGGRSGGEA